jgi:hypothetical protein
MLTVELGLRASLVVGKQVLPVVGHRAQVSVFAGARNQSFCIKNNLHDD